MKVWEAEKPLQIMINRKVQPSLAQQMLQQMPSTPEVAPTDGQNHLALDRARYTCSKAKGTQNTR